MTDLTPWLLTVGAALILTGGGIGVWLLPRRDTPSTDLVAMFDDATAVLPAVTWWEPWVDGWGADGWCPLAELSRLQREAAGLDDDGWRAWLDAHWARAVTADLDATPLLANLVAHVPAIETTRPLELMGAMA